MRKRNLPKEKNFEGLRFESKNSVSSNSEDFTLNQHLSSGEWAQSTSLSCSMAIESFLDEEMVRKC